MHSLIYFDIAAVPIYLIIISTIFYRKMTKGRSNRLFLFIVGVTVLAMFFEMMENLAYITDMPYALRGIWVKISVYGYYVTRHLTNLMYLFFIFSTTRTWYRVASIGRKFILLLPYLATLVMLVINEKTQWIFSIDPVDGYHRGAKVVIIYALASTYMIFGILYLISLKKMLDMGSWISLMSMYFFNIFAVVVQFVDGRLLVECFATALTLLFVVSFIQRPEKQVDMTTGLPGYRAFCEEMGKIKVTGQNVTIMIVCMGNANAMNRYLGNNSYYSYVNVIADQVTLYARKEKVYCELYFEHPGNFYLIMDKDYNPVQALPAVRDSIRKHGRDTLQTGAKPDNRVVTVRFPEDISDIEELLRFGHSFVRFTDPDKIYSKGANIIKRREYQIEAHMDEIINRMTENSTQVYFNLLWSSAKKRYVSAEAVLRLDDPVFGEIDTELLMGASEERGLNLLFENYLMDKVFELAGSGKLKELGLGHISMRISVGMSMQMDLCDKIWELREKYRVDPKEIEFRIKESVYENLSVVLDENLRKLSMQGYLLALDGFGKGYTNLQHMLTMPVSSVWLDENLVRAARTKGGRSLLRGSIQMLKEIPLRVIARGVDDEESVGILQEDGCTYMMGLAFGGTVEKSTIKKLIDDAVK